jgi:hypothetical protein
MLSLRAFFLHLLHSVNFSTQLQKRFEVKSEVLENMQHLIMCCSFPLLTFTFEIISIIFFSSASVLPANKFPFCFASAIMYKRSKSCHHCTMRDLNFRQLQPIISSDISHRYTLQKKIERVDHEFCHKHKSSRSKVTCKLLLFNRRLQQLDRMSIKIH